VRLGVPEGVNGLLDVVRNPIYATGVGLLLFGQHNRDSGYVESGAQGGFKSMLQRMKSWFQGNF
jgi:cell division protein FtsA